MTDMASSVVKKNILRITGNVMHELKQCAERVERVACLPAAVGPPAPGTSRRLARKRCELDGGAPNLS